MLIMIHLFDQMREFTVGSMLFKMTLAVIMGGMIGFERGKKHRPAGFRTHMLVCIGATLSMVLSQYLNYRINNDWAAYLSTMNFSVNTDVARFGAQCINGIGFLGAGTIIVTGMRQVKGLTTAAGLWASACMGLAIGAGVFEAAILACAIIMITTTLFSKIEFSLVSRTRNMDMFIEFDRTDDLGDIIALLKSMDIRLYDVEVARAAERAGAHPSAVFSIGLQKREKHSAIVAAISSLNCVRTIEEL